MRGPFTSGLNFQRREPLRITLWRNDGEGLEMMMAHNYIAVRRYLYSHYQRRPSVRPPFIVPPCSSSSLSFIRAPLRRLIVVE